MPKTKEYDEIRNKIYAELRLDSGKEKRALEKTKQQFNQVGSLIATDVSSFYCLLIVVPEMTECYETLNILKYFDFPIKVDEDNILRQGVKKEMGFRTDDQVYKIFDNKPSSIPSF